MTDSLGLPASEVRDINHPRACLTMWRAEADRLHEIAEAASEEVSRVFIMRMNTLAECAQQLENRLRWSGMLEE